MLFETLALHEDESAPEGAYNKLLHLDDFKKVFDLPRQHNENKLFADFLFSQKDIKTISATI